MKRITLILISLFILVIGVSCAAAADVNTDSVADDNVVLANIGDGDLSAPALAIDDSDRPELERPSIVSTERESDRELDSRGPNIFNGPNIWTTSDLPAHPALPALPAHPALGTSLVDGPVLAGGLGGGGNQNFY